MAARNHSLFSISHFPTSTERPNASARASRPDERRSWLANAQHVQPLPDVFHLDQSKRVGTIRATDQACQIAFVVGLKPSGDTAPWRAFAAVAGQSGVCEEGAVKAFGA